MNPSSVAKFFPRMSTDASRAWVNISPAHSAIDVWLSGALTLKRSIQLESVLEMAARYELQGELLQAREQSIENPERLFVRDATTQMADEVSMAAFLLRAGKPCAIEMTAPVSLERLLTTVFEEYLASVSAKMAGWSMRSAEQKAIAAAS